MHTPQRTEVVACFDIGPARASPVLAEDRLQPYQESLQAGGPVDQELIARCGPTIEDGYQAALQLSRMLYCEIFWALSSWK